MQYFGKQSINLKFCGNPQIVNIYLFLLDTTYQHCYYLQGVSYGKIIQNSMSGSSRQQQGFEILHGVLKNNIWGGRNWGIHQGCFKDSPIILQGYTKFDLVSINHLVFPSADILRQGRQDTILTVEKKSSMVERYFFQS